MALTALPMNELLDVLRPVLTERVEHPVAGLWGSVVLAEVWWGAGTYDAVPTDYSNTEISVVAWPDRDYYDGGLGPDQGLWEEGTCTTCGLTVVSTGKRAACPRCGGACELT
jgi:hypothetical protein